MGFLGSNRGLTPHLDAMARQGIVFTRAYSHVPLTTASHATILTGTYPQFNHVNDFWRSLSPRLPYLARAIASAWIPNGSVCGIPVLDPLDGTAPGFDRGFEVYDAGFHLRRPGIDRYKTIERRGGTVVITLWHGSARHPIIVFSFGSICMTHMIPMTRLRPIRNATLRSLMTRDCLCRRLCRQIAGCAAQAWPSYDEALVAVMADHGSLLEHTAKILRVFLYDENLHVPLLIQAAAHRAAGKR